VDCVRAGGREISLQRRNVVENVRRQRPESDLPVQKCPRVYEERKSRFWGKKKVFALSRDTNPHRTTEGHSQPLLKDKHKSRDQ